MQSTNAVDTVRYRAHFMKNGRSLSDAVLFLLKFMPRYFQLLSTTTERGPQLVLEEADGNILPTQQDGTQNRAASRQRSTRTEYLSPG